jgi:hypothetical protein
MTECPFLNSVGFAYILIQRAATGKLLTGSHNHRAADRPELQLVQLLRLVSNTDLAKLVAEDKFPVS